MRVAREPRRLAGERVVEGGFLVAEAGPLVALAGLARLAGELPARLDSLGAAEQLA
jgi:hypothetical protein